jgi:hypothetical protein
VENNADSVIIVCDGHWYNGLFEGGNKSPCFGGVMVKTLASRAEGSEFNTWSRHIIDLFLEPIQSIGAEWTLKCVCVPMSGTWVAAAQALVAAIALLVKQIDFSVTCPFWETVASYQEGPL